MLFPEDAPKVSRADLARALAEWSVFEAQDRHAEQRGGRRKGRVGKYNALADALKETSFASTPDALATAHTNWKTGRSSRA
jgi:hypothetical protein